MNKKFLENLDPRSKIFFSIVVVLLAIIVPALEYLLALIIITVLLIILSRKLKKWLSYLSVFKILIPLLFFLNLFFYANGKTYFSLDLSVIKLSVTRGGVIASIIILLRLFSIAGAAALFVVSTEAVEMETALSELKFPWKLAFLFSLTLKLIPEMKTRYRKIEEAQLSRGVKMTGGPIERTKKKVPMLIPFIASITRYGYELGEALEARDFNDVKERTSLLELKHGFGDLLLYLLSICVISLYIYLYFL